MWLQGQSGVFITRVSPGGAADRAGIVPDDRLLEVNGVTVHSLSHQEVVQLIQEAGCNFEVRVEKADLAEDMLPPPPPPGLDLPELDSPPRPPSRSALAPPAAEEAHLERVSPPAGRAHDFLPEPSQEAPRTAAPPPPAPPAHQTALPSARSLPSLVDPALFRPQAAAAEPAAPRLPPRRAGSRPNLLLNPADFDVQGFINSLVSVQWRQT